MITGSNSVWAQREIDEARDLLAGHVSEAQMENALDLVDKAARGSNTSLVFLASTLCTILKHS